MSQSLTPVPVPRWGWRCRKRIWEELTPLQGCGEHPHLTPCSSPGESNPAPAGEHKAKEEPTANPTSGEKNILAGAWNVPWCAGNQSGLIPDEENTHSMWMLPWNLKDAQCLSFCWKILCRRNTALIQFSFTWLLRSPAESWKSKSTCVSSFLFWCGW